MSRPSKAKIRLSAIAHNLDQVHQAAPGSKIMAVIKADAYGHGIVAAANAMPDADGFAVACLEEAMILREAGIKKKILLLEGVFSAKEIPMVQSAQLDLVVHTPEQVELLDKLLDIRGLAGNSQVWMKLDTGMHRLGFPAHDFSEHYRQLQTRLNNTDFVLMTHFANADDRHDKFTQSQLNLFNQVTQDFACEKSLANSAAILARPDTHADWVRPGIMLYGSSPLLTESAEQHKLLAVMSLESELIAVRSLKKGDRVGYGGLFECPQDMQVGVVAIGYGDGYPRHAPTGTPIVVAGQRTQLIGRVSMDMISVDLRTVKNAQVGSKVELWGDVLPVDEVAHHCGTIAYELLCQIGKRIPRIYIEN